MFKYTSTNRLDAFHFHDCFLIEVKAARDNSIWVLNHIDVEKENSLNQFHTAMETDMAIITFYDCKYRNLEIDYAENLPKDRIAAIDLLEANTRFSYHTVSYLLQTGESMARVCIRFADHLYTFEIEYSRVTVKWNVFIRKSWYERNKARFEQNCFLN